jgi:hypothetical protein
MHQARVRLSACTCRLQARAWQTFAQNCSHPYDQLASRRNAVTALEATPLQQVEYQLEFAEWAAASGLEDGAAVANQLLLEAAQVLQQHELDQTGGWRAVILCDTSILSEVTCKGPGSSLLGLSSACVHWGDLPFATFAALLLAGVAALCLGSSTGQHIRLSLLCWCWCVLQLLR